MDEMQIKLARVIEKYFGADVAYLDIDAFTLAKQIMEDGWEKPVRCKDCKHYAKIGEWDKDKRCNVFTGCYDQPYPTKPENFCSFGERRE